MFQFTREFIINDNIGKLKPNKTRFVVKDGVMYVDNMVNIRKKDVHAIYKHDYEPEVKESVTVKGSAITGVAQGEVVRLVITLGQQGKTTATFNDYYPDHSRHLYYETTATAATPTADDVIDGLLASVAHEATLRGEKFVEINKVGSDLVINALDCYTTVKEVRIVKLPVADAASKIGAILTGYEDWDLILDWKRKEHSTSAVDFVEGKEGNGNTVQILKNMRLLTDANLNPYGLDMDERPLPKGEYDQYTVEIATERRHIGHDVMGSVGTSLTTFVFYVLRSATCEANNVSADFEEALTDLWEQAPLAAKPAEGTKENAPKRVLAHTSDLPEPEDEGGSTSTESK